MNSYYDIFPSPVGSLLAAVDDTGAVTDVSFLPDGDAGKAPVHPGQEAVPIRDARRVLPVRTQLEEYFAGRRRAFDLPLAPAGTDFQRRVWNALLAVAYGETRSYGQIALAAGSPGAARAVGAAARANRIPIVIPCHRVIGADGSLTGFAGGMDIKRRLLRLEGIIID